jgi:hypothetical protein
MGLMLIYHSTRANDRKHKLSTIRVISEQRCRDRIYRLLEVTTEDGTPYYCLRLLNGRGHFIKQFLFEPEMAAWLREALIGL